MKALVLALALILSPVVATAYNIAERTDEFTKETTIYQEANGNTEEDGQLVYNEGRHWVFNLHYNPDSQGLRMFVGFYGKGWLFIQRGQESLLFLVDGDVIGFTPASVQRHVVKGSTVTEWFFIDLPYEKAMKLIEANTVKCRIIGNNFYTQVDDMSTIKERWKGFVYDHVKDVKD